uniref:2Fe-2S ferredoxin-type domain-containing protein n=1 Tax=Rhabditophanes sp. KR3021 TaxID=114890 RepID=A0AC35TM52_9BILA
MLRNLVSNVFLRYGKIQSRLLATESTKIKITFHTEDGDYVGNGSIGESLLDVMINNDLPLDGFGACEGTVACCTCHVVLKQEHFDRLAKPDEEEMDMLDLAPVIEDCSRLGCQVILDKRDKPEMHVTVPEIARDARTI